MKRIMKKIRKLELDFEDMSKYDGYYKRDSKTSYSEPAESMPEYLQTDYYTKNDKVLSVDQYFKLKQ